MLELRAKWAQEKASMSLERIGVLPKRVLLHCHNRYESRRCVTVGATRCSAHIHTILSSSDLRKSRCQEVRFSGRCRKSDKPTYVRLPGTWTQAYRAGGHGGYNALFDLDGPPARTPAGALRPGPHHISFPPRAHRVAGLARTFRLWRVCFQKLLKQRPARRFGLIVVP